MTGVPGDTLILRAVGPAIEFGAVPCVLGASGRSEIGPSVVEAIVIDMVHKHIVRDFEYLAVHGKLPLFSVFGFNSADGVKGFIPSGSVPFVFAEVIIIIGVNDGEFTLRQRYPPEGVAVANTTVEKNRQDTEPLKPNRYF